MNVAKNFKISGLAYYRRKTVHPSRRKEEKEDEYCFKEDLRNMDPHVPYGGKETYKTYEGTIQVSQKKLLRVLLDIPEISFKKGPVLVLLCGSAISPIVDLGVWGGVIGTCAVLLWCSGVSGIRAVDRQRLGI